MASWYSSIYAYVRRVRERRLYLGRVLYLLLNVILVAQLLFGAYSYFVYTFIVCGRMLTNSVQITFYLCVYHLLLFMTLWSLLQTLRTPIARVPDQFKVDQETDSRLKLVTPCIGGRFVAERSTDEQTTQQHTILRSLVAFRQLGFVETAECGRFRYCYQCSLLKPDRSHHCSSCGFCVVKFDHHCPWINKCINFDNYKFFMLYLTYAVGLIVWGLLTSIEVLVRYFVNQKWTEELGGVLQVTICIVTHASFGYFLLGELLVYHLKLIVLNETTCEQAKIPSIRGDPRATYNFGLAANFRAVYGWGLWAFPLDTHVIDGLHFPVNYSAEAVEEEKLVVRRLTTESSTITIVTANSTDVQTHKSELQIVAVN